MLKLMSQPSTTFMTKAIAYMFTPDIRIVMKAKVTALSPLATLERGYAIVHRGEDVVRSPAQLTSGDAVAVRVAEGTFGATVD